LFSQKAFIDASRDFVCVRLESYESKEHQDMVRSFLDGRFENTAFCILAPDGEKRLSGTGRSPAMGLGAGGPRGNADFQRETVLESMAGIATQYKPKGDPHNPIVQDFHSFHQALNVAAADQRLLLLVAAPEKTAETLRTSLRPVMGNADFIGRFHSDFADKETDAKWTDAVSGAEGTNGLFIIAADQFGMKGEVLEQIPLDAEPEEIEAALTRANIRFAETEERKVYREHVAEGRQEGIMFDSGMPYGEDRDGDGEIDHRGALDRGKPGQGGPRRGGPGKGGPGKGGPRPGGPPEPPPGL
jgi:hypothetical protein